MLSIGFNRYDYINCVYFRMYNVSDSVYLLLYFDVVLIASKSKSKIFSLKTTLNSEFEMKDLGHASKVLSMDISRNCKSGNAFYKNLV